MSGKKQPRRKFNNDIEDDFDSQGQIGRYINTGKLTKKRKKGGVKKLRSFDRNDFR